MDELGADPFELNRYHEVIGARRAAEHTEGDSGDDAAHRFRKSPTVVILPMAAQTSHWIKYSGYYATKASLSPPSFVRR
jgi:hypothetical protein